MPEAALPRLGATLAGPRDLIARARHTAAASRDGLARTRTLTERSGTLPGRAQIARWATEHPAAR